MNKQQAQNIIHFWFDHNSPIPTPKEKKIWFFKKFDHQISSQFKPLIPTLSPNLPNNLQHLLQLFSKLTSNINHHNPKDICLSIDQYVYITFQTILAYIILFDQMAKNIFRNQSEAFQFQNTISNFSLNFLKSIHPNILQQIATPKQFHFIILSIIHQENLSNFQFIKTYSQQFFQNQSPQIQENIYIPLQNSISKHKNILQQFNRYPKRNNILNRQSTPEEELYITQSQNKFL